MLLITLFGVITLIGIVIWIIGYKQNAYYGLHLTGVLVFTFSGIIFVSMLIGIGIAKETNATTYNQLQTREEILIIQYETALESGNLIVVSEVYGLIINYNDKIIKHKTHSDSLWIGAFYSKGIASLDLISISKNNNKEQDYGIDIMMNKGELK